MTNRLDKIDEKLDIIIEKVSKLEVRVEIDSEELKSIKKLAKEHDNFITRVKGIVAFVGFVGVAAVVKYFV